MPTAIRAVTETGTETADHAVTPAKFRDLVAAEWIKYRSLRSSLVAVAMLGFLTCAGAAFSAWHLDLTPYGISTFDPVGHAFGDDVWATLMSLAACIGGASLLGEFSSGQMRTTLIAVPDRRRLVLAKTAMMACWMTTVGAALAVAALASSQLILEPAYRARPFDTTAASVNVLVCGVALGVSAVLGMALAAILRNTVATLMTAFLVVQSIPSMVEPTSGPWSVLSKSLPRHAWEGLADTDIRDNPGIDMHAFPHSAAAWPGFAVWLVVGAVLMTVLVRRRDV